MRGLRFGRTVIGMDKESTFSPERICFGKLNILERGKNYGWPVIHHRDTRAEMESPILEYTPACAPASGMFYRGAMFPQFKGNFFFGCLRGERIIRVATNGRQVVS